MSEQPSTRTDFLWEQISGMPYFRGLLRAVEARFYQDFKLESPTLDLGCGDGHFVTIAFDKPLDVGIDPWTGPVHQAVRRGGYRLVIQGNGDQMPISDGYFASAISNSVLEHIPDVEAVLSEVSRVLKPGGTFLFCVPNQNFLSNLSISTFLDRIGLRGLGDRYRAFFNRISRHHHCDTPEVWQARLEKSGFHIERWWHYFSPEALHVLEWGHYFGLPALITQKLFGHWILLPAHWNLALTKAIVQPYYDEPVEQPKGSYTFYVVRKNA
jgi:SAM-dependent methyltransferase